MAVSLGPFQRATAVQWPAGGWELISALPAAVQASDVNVAFNGFEPSGGYFVFYHSLPTSTVYTFTESGGFSQSVTHPGGDYVGIDLSGCAYVGSSNVIAGWTRSDASVHLLEASLGGSWSVVHVFPSAPGFGDPDIRYTNVQHVMRVPGTNQAYMVVSGPGADNPNPGGEELWFYNGSTVSYVANIPATFLQELFYGAGAVYVRDFFGWQRYDGPGWTTVTADFTTGTSARITAPTNADTKILSKPDDTFSGLPGTWSRVLVEDGTAPFPTVVLSPGAGWDSNDKVWLQVNRQNNASRGVWKFTPAAGQY